jgi:membrane-associated phospholipid phosphatase
VHASYFFGFVVVGLGVWLWRRERFAAFTRVLLCTFALGLAGYALLPTEPPWLAAREGYAQPAQRILVRTAQETSLTAGMLAVGQTTHGDRESLGDPNPEAAMPSVHTAVTASLALFLAGINPVLGLLGLLYLLAMGGALVYLGEHYVLDVAAGVLCALLATWIAPRLGRSSPSREVRAAAMTPEAREVPTSRPGPAGRGAPEPAPAGPAGAPANPGRAG